MDDFFHLADFPTGKTEFHNHHIAGCICIISRQIGILFAACIPCSLFKGHHAIGIFLQVGIFSLHDPVADIVSLDFLLTLTADVFVQFADRNIRIGINQISHFHWQIRFPLIPLCQKPQVCFVALFFRIAGNQRFRLLLNRDQALLH